MRYGQSFSAGHWRLGERVCVWRSLHWWVVCQREFLKQLPGRCALLLNSADDGKSDNEVAWKTCKIRRMVVRRFGVARVGKCDVRRLATDVFCAEYTLAQRRKVRLASDARQ